MQNKTFNQVIFTTPNILSRVSPVFIHQRSHFSPSRKICTKVSAKKAQEQDYQQQQQQQYVVQQPVDIIAQQNQIRQQFFLNPLNWFLIFVLGTVINFVFRNLIGGFLSAKQQSLKGLRNFFYGVFGVLPKELSEQQKCLDEVSLKLKNVEDELSIVKQQLDKRESQLQEALDVADQLEQQVLVSIQTIKDKDEQIKNTDYASAELQAANEKIKNTQQQLQQQQLTSQQELQRKLNDSISQLHQIQKLYENEKISSEQLRKQISEFENQLKNQKSSSNEEKDKELKYLMDKVNQLEDIKEDRSNLMIKLRDYEDELEDIKKQLEESKNSYEELQTQNQNKIEEIIQEKNDLKVQQQEITDQMQEQINKARVDAQNSDKKFDQLKSQLSGVFSEIVGTEQREKFEQILEQSTSSQHSEQNMDELKDVFSSHINSTVQESNRELQLQMRKLKEEYKQNSENYLTLLNQMKKDLDQQQNFIQNLMNENKDGNGNLNLEMDNLSNQLEKSKQEISNVSKKYQDFSASIQQPALQNDSTLTEDSLTPKLKSSATLTTKPTEVPSPPPPSISTPQKVISTGATLPHPNKLEKGGDDAYFVEGIHFGVADGVGGWEKEGIDPGAYSRRLMENYGFEIQKLNPTQALQNAQDATLVEGSCTACGAKLGVDGVLEVINVGDTGCRVFRNYSCVFQTRPQMHQFNMPYQLAWPKFLPNANMASSGNYYKVKCQKGDVIILATDGYFDNVWDKDTGEILKKYYLNDINRQNNSQKNLYKLARQMCEQAQKNAVDQKYQSPFVIEVARSGVTPWGSQLFRKGGKLDDCTVAIAEVL